VASSPSPCRELANIRKSLAAAIDTSTAADPEQFLDQCAALIDAHRTKEESND